jgi:hypothetical protein
VLEKRLPPHNPRLAEAEAGYARLLAVSGQKARSFQ